jgi:hypothetical protein
MSTYRRGSQSGGRVSGTNPETGPADAPEQVVRKVRQKGPPRLDLERYRGPYVDIDLQPFTNKRVQDVVAAVGHPLAPGMTEADVQERLNGCAQWYAYHANTDLEPTRQSQRAALLQLAKGARLLKDHLPLLPTTEASGLDPFTPNVSSALLNLLQAPLDDLMDGRVAEERKAGGWAQTETGWRRVEDMTIDCEAVFGAASPRDLLEHMAQAVEVLLGAVNIVLKDFAREPSPPPQALRETVITLSKLYVRAFGRTPVIANDRITQRPAGPLLRFLNVCLDVIGAPSSPDNLQRIVKAARLRATTKTPQNQGISAEQGKSAE